MIHVIIWLIIFAIYYFFHVYKASVEEKEAEEEQFFQELMNGGSNESENMNERECPVEMTVTELVLHTLRNIGCNPQIKQQEHYNSISFTFQAENFIIECLDGSPYIKIIAPWWYGISVYNDIEEITSLYKAINLSNQYSNCITLYSIDKEAEEIGVHCKKHILFIGEIPQINFYLRRAFDDIFVAQRFFLAQLEKCKVTENQ